LEQQRAAISCWAAQHGYRIVQEFADTGSGLDVSRRSGFQALLAACADRERRAADRVLIYDVSRFSRLEPDEAAWHEHSLRRAGVKVTYTHEPGVNDDGIAGHLVKSLRRAMAHDFSVKLSQVVRRGMRAHAERGGWTGGRPPFGYRRALVKADGTTELLTRRKAKGEKSTLVVEPVEAGTVLDIFTSYAVRGLGIGAIANMLNSRRVPGPTSDRRIGQGCWTKVTLGTGRPWRSPTCSAR
jgi:site-specific DNA recombinase